MVDFGTLLLLFSMMINVINMGIWVACTKLKQIAHRINQIICTECHFRFRNILREFPVYSKSPNAPEAIAIGVKELLLEQLLSFFQLRRVSGPHPLIDS